MMKIVKAVNRHFSDFGWLKTYWLFSFSDYYDPENIGFGFLRVFNDDRVEPGTGFLTHPHEEMEIVTIVLEGEMTHEDSMGNKSIIRSGDVQRMSAGTGLTHSEFNLSDAPVHFYQIWVFPDIPRLSPTYDQKSFKSSDFLNCLFPVASGQGKRGAVRFHTDATIYRCDLEKERVVSFNVPPGRRIFVYLTKGIVRVNEMTLSEKDQGRIDGDGLLVFKGNSASQFVMIDVASERRS